MIDQLDLPVSDTKDPASRDSSDRRQRRLTSSHRRPVYIPSGEEILSECRRIQKSWTPEERRQRQVAADTVPWSVPWLRLADLEEVLP